jgi:hypothetical protein
MDQEARDLRNREDEDEVEEELERGDLVLGCAWVQVGLAARA